MCRWRRLIEAACVTYLLTPMSHAGAVTYEVNINASFTYLSSPAVIIGPLVDQISIQGSISTDGHFELFGAKDITSWNLVVTDALGTFRFAPSNSTLSGYKLGATPTFFYTYYNRGELDFNGFFPIPRTSLFLLWLDIYNAPPGIWIQMGECLAPCPNPNYNPYYYQIENFSYEHEQSLAPIANVTPLPSAMQLFAAGLGLVYFALIYSAKNGEKIAIPGRDRRLAVP